MCQKVQNLFDIMFHVEHDVGMNTFEEVPFPTEEEIVSLMKKYRYNIVQMKTMQELGYNDDNYEKWKREYSDKFRDQFISYLNVAGLYEDPEGKIDVDNAAKVIAGHLINKGVNRFAA